MKRITLILAVISAILLASCAEPPVTGIPAELREIMKAGRAIALPPPRPGFAEASASLLTPNLSAETDARIAEIVASTDPAGSMAHRHRIVGMPQLQAWLTHEEIAEEIYFLFDLLRYGYAGYQYFGGDDVFLPLRDSMLERLASMDNPMRASAYLNGLLVPSLRGTIMDNHFYIFTNGFGPPSYATLLSEDFVLRRSGGDLVTEIDGRTYRLVETTLRDGAPAQGVLPTLTREGEFAFAFGLFAPLADPLAREIIAHLECTRSGERHTRGVHLARPGNYTPMSRPLLATREAGGVLVVESRSMLAPANNFENARADFYQSGGDARGKPALVLDLRGNYGGSRLLGSDWIRGYAGQPPSSDLAFAGHSLLSRTAMRRLNANAIFEWEEDEVETAWAQHGGFCDSAKLEPLPNDGLVIVLMDNTLFSAGELFIGYLRQLENVLFVGTNTRGVLLTGGISRTRLPRSGFDVSFGFNLNLRPDLSRFEGVGFLPDLWVPPRESLERVLAFIERYGLNR